ncbi:hypothetical protein ACQ4PT_048335 [Festuca glaucescens]
MLAAAAAASSASRPTVVDPKFEWAEKADRYVLRLTLSGFKKDDFIVHVDGTGRLTVTGTAAGQSSFNKVFQLPSAASLDDIAGSFGASVLTLTIPKRASLAPAPTSIKDSKSKQPGVAKEEDITKEDASKKKKKAIDEAATKTTQQPLKQEEEASTGKQEQEKPGPAQVKKAPEAATAPPQKPAPVKKEEMNPKAPHTTTTSPPGKLEGEEEQEKEEVKPKAPQTAAASPPKKPAPVPEAATDTNKPKAAVVTPESLAERVRRCSEEEGANAATETEGEKKAIAACSGWKERVQGELKVLTDMKWADGVLEAARKNK